MSEEKKDEHDKKKQIYENFASSIKLVKDLVLNLKKVPIDSLLDTIDSTADQLNQLTNNFQLYYELLMKYNEKDENDVHLDSKQESEEESKKNEDKPEED